ncbi:MAG: polyribonucleotide nucleotidyltransferase [Candidatus Dadabacteria bacterium]|nr:MAG: polyribonucleotide nucleotidyltransferase [Candidatus Dadabacteria bacterium]
MAEVSCKVGEHEVIFNSGEVAKQASGAVLVKSGESVVLVTAVLGEEKDLGFFPLTFDYIEKTYAAGKIPGGFFKREGKLNEKETLTSRLIDRPCRPLFPKGFKREVQMIATVLSADPDCDTDVYALCGASAALMVSEIPFEGPIAGVRVGRVKGEFVLNPSQSTLEESDMDLVVAVSRDAIVMVEGEAKEVPEEEIVEALFFAHKEAQPLIDAQLELVKQVGKEKITFEKPELSEEIKEKVKALAESKAKSVLQIPEKLKRRQALKEYREEVFAKLAEEYTQEEYEEKVDEKEVQEYLEELESNTVREMIFSEGRRIDGRDNKTVRPIDIKVGWLPRAHGSALFTRGETQAVVTTTLGVEDEAQKIDTLLGDEFKTFMLHYNFPPFSVGEIKPLRAPARREIGHGALAERAVKAVLPSQEEFPYVIRVVSEITESNGSSSMATVCGACLSLMDAGVPIKDMVAGIAMGLLMKESGEYVVLTDILGDEDHLGDMDFKVCGTKRGVTAVQMDIKVKGLTREIMSEALTQAKEARMYVLEKMRAVIDKPRETISKYAPRVERFKIDPDKIRDLIGPSGKTIKSICETWDVKINISEDGTVLLYGSDDKQIRSAKEACLSMTEKAEVGKIYKGVVKRIADFGAFVEILPGTDGLVHISQLAEGRVRRVSDVLKEGDEVWVKVLEVDRQGKIRLSHKEAIAELNRQKRQNASK